MFGAIGSWKRWIWLTWGTDGQKSRLLVPVEQSVGFCSRHKLRTLKAFARAANPGVSALTWRNPGKTLTGKIRYVLPRTLGEGLWFGTYQGIRAGDLGLGKLMYFKEWSLMSGRGKYPALLFLSVGPHERSQRAS